MLHMTQKLLAIILGLLHPSENKLNTTGVVSGKKGMVFFGEGFRASPHLEISSRRIKRKRLVARWHACHQILAGFQKLLWCQASEGLIRLAKVSLLGSTPHVSKV